MLLLGLSATLVGLLLAGGGVLATTARRTNFTRRAVVAYAPDASLLMLVGPQSACPPLVRCPQYATLGRGIAVWWIGGPTDLQATPLWQGVPEITQRRLVYVAVE